MRAAVPAMQLPTLPEALHAPLPAAFISDLHLSEDEPDTVAAFIDFLAAPARAHASLFILGDLFECWAGDDDVDTALHRRVTNALHELAAHGVAVFFMQGNRDLLAGAGFAAAAGLQLLRDPVLLRFGSADDAPAVLLSHGDQLCTDDAAYQAYRRQVHDPAWQANFLSRPLAERKAFIAGLRQHSEAAKRDKPMAIMDVNADAVAALLRAHHYPTLVHGHTHRPALHQHEVDGRRCERHVLADWHGAASWLSFDGGRFRHCGTGAQQNPGPIR